MMLGIHYRNQQNARKLINNVDQMKYIIRTGPSNFGTGPLQSPLNHIPLILKALQSSEYHVD